MSDLHELVDVYDNRPMTGEYTNIPHTQPFTAFTGETVEAFTPDHANRLVISRRWDNKCECCNHHLRYCFITTDSTGGFHCFGQQ